MTITELVLENQKLKLDAQREAEHHDRMVGELEKVYAERDEAREKAERYRLEANAMMLQRDEARERCSKLEKTMSYSSGATTLLSRFLKVLNERNGLIQKMDAWEEIAEHLHHLVQHPAYGVDQAIRRMDVLEAYKHLKNGH